MRIAILSDIHGNDAALAAVLGDLARRGPVDQIVAAGDLAWAGPRPAEVVDRLQTLNAAVIQGNTDAFFGRTVHETPAGKDDGRFAVHLTWMQEQLGRERVRWLTHLPFSHSVSPTPDHKLLIVHANPVDQERGLLSTLADAELDEMLLAQGREPGWAALAFGHVHIPGLRLWRDRLLVNAASTGLPMDGDSRAAYAILTWDGGAWSVEHHRVAYDATAVARDMIQVGMPRGKHFAERLLAAKYAS